MRRTAVFVCLLLLMLSASVNAQVTSGELTVLTNDGHLKGSLLMPADSTHAVPVVLIIAGSGPTDRDGNSPMLKCDAYKLLAEQLGSHGIASFRYDKRGIGASTDFKENEADLSFDDYVNDAIACINYLKADVRFTKVVVAGHSEGALIGLLACKQTNANQYISLCGAGQPLDAVLIQQLTVLPPARLPEQYKKESFRIIDSLKQGKQVAEVSPALYSLFRNSVQPYLISMMKYNPAAELATLKTPTLLIAAGNDIQIGKSDAAALKKANSKAKLVTIKGMNHVFRIVENDEENRAAYNKPELPLATGLVEEVVEFVKGK